VVGFSGGNKYLVPGIAGPEILNLFHWLGALITNPSIIGRKRTAVRAVIDRAARLVPVERRCASLVVEETALAGLYLGAPEEAWERAATLSGELHVITVDRPYRSVLSITCATTS
jgi:lactate racemase